MIKIKLRFILLWGGFVLAFFCLLTGLKAFCTEMTLESEIHTEVQKIQNRKESSSTTTTHLSKNEPQSTKNNAVNVNNANYTQEQNQKFQSDIAKNILRLHVIANSDSDYDQQLKLKVRDEIITSLQDSLRNADSVLQAKACVANRQAQIQTTALRVLQAHNCNFSVKVSVCKRYFPVKQYGDLTFPAGTYDALCVEIGKAQGHNWWCVLFPSLCFVNETTATVPDNSKEKIKECLPEDEYNRLTKEENADTEIHLGIVDWFTNTD